MKRIFPLLLLLFVATAAGQDAASGVRQWTSRDGSYHVEAEWIDETDDGVVLRRADGKRIEVPKAKLSDQDLEYLSQRTPPATARRPDAAVPRRHPPAPRAAVW